MITLLLFIIEMLTDLSIEHLEHNEVHALDFLIVKIILFIISTIFSVIISLIFRKYFLIAMVLWTIYLIRITNNFIKIKGEMKND